MPAIHCPAGRAPALSPRGPLSEAARAHLSPKRPLGPGDAYEADVEPEAAGSPGVRGDTLPGWLHHLLPGRRPTAGTGGDLAGATAPGMPAETPLCRGLAGAERGRAARGG